MVRLLPTAAAVVLACSFLLPTAFAEDNGRAQIDAARELYASGDWETAKEAYETAYKEAPEDSVLKAEAALEWSSVLWEQGYYKDAEVRVKDALARAKKLKLDHAIGRLMLTQGHIQASLGKLSSAETTLQICAKMAHDQKDANFAALCRINLRFVKQLRGRSVPSQAKYQKDLDTLKKSGHALLVGTALAKTAESYSKMGDNDAALDLLSRAQAQFTKANSVPAKSRNRLRRAQVYQDMGRWKDAQKDLTGLVLRFQNMRNRPSLVTAYALNARQAEFAGKHAEAQNLYAKSLKTAKSLGSPQLVGNSYLALCEYYVRLDQPKKALPNCRESEKTFKKAGVPDLALRAQIALARMQHMQGDLKGARQAYVKVVTDLEKRAKTASQKRNLGIQQTNLCQVELALKTSGAKSRCKAALKTVESLKPPKKDLEGQRLLASNHYAVGALAYQENRAKEANNHLTAAALTYDLVEDKPRAAEAYLRLGRLQLRKKKAEIANKSFATALERAGNDPVTLETRVQLRIQYAQGLMDVEDWANAKKQLESLEQEATARKDFYSRAWGKSALARVELKLGNKDGAISALEAGIGLAKKAKDKELEQNMKSNLKKLK